MPVKPNVVSQLMGQSGMGRPGGMMSKMSSSPAMQSTKGAGFSAMENSLLKGSTPNPKSLAGGGSGRQFGVQAAGGDAGGATKLPKAFGYKRLASSVKGKTPKY